VRLFRAAALSAFFVFAGSASAQNALPREHHNVSISTGREGRLAYYASPDAACRHGTKPAIAILEEPSYGKIVMRPERLIATGSSVPPRASNCRGKFADAISVYFKPAAGFHGSDRAVLRVDFPAAANGPAWSLVDVIYISVR